MARFRLKDGSITNNPIETWLDKTEEELQILREAGQLPHYVEEAISAKKASQKPEPLAKQPEPKKPQRKVKAVTAANKPAAKVKPATPGSKK